MDRYSVEVKSMRCFYFCLVVFCSALCLVLKLWLLLFVLCVFVWSSVCKDFFSRFVFNDLDTDFLVPFLDTLFVLIHFAVVCFCFFAVLSGFLVSDFALFWSNRFSFFFRSSWL